MALFVGQDRSAAAGKRPRGPREGTPRRDSGHAGGSWNSQFKVIGRYSYHDHYTKHDHDARADAREPRRHAPYAYHNPGPGGVPSYRIMLARSCVY